MEDNKTESSIIIENKFLDPLILTSPIKFHDVARNSLFLIKLQSRGRMPAQRLEKTGQVVKKIARRPLCRGYAVTYAADDRENRYRYKKAQRGAPFAGGACKNTRPLHCRGSSSNIIVVVVDVVARLLWDYKRGVVFAPPPGQNNVPRQTGIRDVITGYRKWR